MYGVVGWDQSIKKILNVELSSVDFPGIPRFFGDLFTGDFFHEDFFQGTFFSGELIFGNFRDAIQNSKSQPH